ncbi:hypothetical protein EDC96DRAFT_612770 [Choanephora cucurbitarum]|nr:hypothetical protein EDC96DRAFT_612770 [Choanephora cucurbitarum]
MLFLLEKRDQLVTLDYKSVNAIKKDVSIAWKSVVAEKNLKNIPYDKVKDYIWAYFVEPKAQTQKKVTHQPSSSQSKTIAKSATSTKVSKKKRPEVFDSKIKSIHGYPLESLPLFPSINGHNPLLTNNSSPYPMSSFFLNPKPLEFLPAEKSNQLYASITTPLFENIPSVPPAILADFDVAFSSFASDHDSLLFSSNTLAIANKSSDPIIHSLVHSFITLANEIAAPSIPNLSEMHIQCSFVHPLLRGVLKPLPSLVPHCSNKFAFENDHHVMHCRPDYRVDNYDTIGDYSGTNLFGELKPADATAEDIAHDFHKCMCLGKVALKQFNYDFLFRRHLPSFLPPPFLKLSLDLYPSLTFL